MSSNGKLTGKVAVVTASTEGIGFAIAKKLAKDGAKVVISSRKEKNVSGAMQELKEDGLDIAGTVCHVGKSDDRKKLLDLTLEKYGGLDILVSNAAVNPFFGSMLDCPEDMWEKIFDINVKTAFLLFKECAPLMQERGGGSAIFISSVGGFQPLPFLGPYSVSKTALLGLTKCLAAETAQENIRVNCVAPGLIRTKFAEVLTENEGIAEKVLEGIPMRRFGIPDDIGGIVSFLASDDSAYITGENIVVAGGTHCRL